MRFNLVLVVCKSVWGEVYPVLVWCGVCGVRFNPVVCVGEVYLWCVWVRFNLVSVVYLWCVSGHGVRFDPVSVVYLWCARVFGVRFNPVLVVYLWCVWGEA